MNAAIRPFEAEDRSALIGLWRACGLVVPRNDPGRDVDRKLRADPAGLLVAPGGGALVGSVMAGYDGHRGWINYLAVAPSHRRRGLGRQPMQHAEALLRSRGCPKINLQVREGNTDVLAFYEAIGFSPDACVSLGKRLVDDTDPQRDEPGDGW